ncbi:MAG TPA: glycoside hydrolase family 3 N-terminal domain-containing protein [bacterium]|nr:glycoside hydrolase family 3 N-terminal domain-containing protein [bacterium]HQJ65574.1 glycoside hydrolase family 3 N-terminal domain-containing protein [bacterium]
MRKLSLPALALVLVLFWPILSLSQIPGYGTDVDKRVEDLLARMTLEEKIGQLQQYSASNDSAFARMAKSGSVGSFLNVRGAAATNALQKLAVENSRLGIPILFGLDVIHGYQTIFPIPLAEAASWDPALVEQAATVAAREARAAGIHWTFAPMVDIARDSRWGRIAEGSGEDPFLGSRMAIARVRGFQGERLHAPDRVAACLKHYVGYGAAEGGRDYNTTEISDQTLRNIYLPPFAAGVRAGAATLMSAFNDLNGIPASANPFTLDHILRQEWGFRGFVVSDWNSIGELITHGVAQDCAEAAIKSLNAGVEMDMESHCYQQSLRHLVESGQISLRTIDEAVRRVLRIKILLGLFENPYADPKREKEVMLAKPHQELALQMARESIVLLKNAGNLLPLGRPKTIAVIGPLANARADLLGTWCCEGDSNQVVTVLEGIRRTLGSQTRILTASGCDLDGTNGRNVPAAVALAQQADVIIAVIGESASMSGEASSRSSLNLPGLQEGLIKALAATQKPVVAVILAGRPLTIPWLAENVPAMVMAWHGGTQAGQAIADVLFGAYNPSGRLPISWPRSASQLPLYYNHKNTGRPAADSKYTSRYIDLPSGSQYPFGFGLSYSRFEYANLKLDTAEIGPAGFLQVSAEVKNSGSREGEEVVQLYIHDLVGSLTRPVRELKGFQRIHLLPGQSRSVHFTLGPDELGFYDAENRFLVEPGRFQLWIGPNCTEGLQGEFTVR